MPTREQKINWLKYELMNTLHGLIGAMEKGHFIGAYKGLIKLKNQYYEMFPFKYGSEQRGKYTDERVYGYNPKKKES